MSSRSNQSWREILPVHPATDLFPLMSEPELRKLSEDIRKNGLQIPIVVWFREDREDRHKDPKQYRLLDGRNRLDAMELVGIPFQLCWHKDFRCWALGADCINENAIAIDVQKGDPYELVVSANIHRRHLTGEQKRAL